MAGPQTVLVVEDDDVSAEIMVKLLEAHGYDVRRARDGREGLSLVRSLEPALILLDVRMPEMSGLEVCRALRAEGSAFVPIILVTANTEKSDLVAGLEAGADDYLPKPYEPIELLARVRSLLRIKRMHDELQDTIERLSSARQENTRLRKEVQEKLGAAAIITNTPAMLGLLEQLEAARHGMGPVLITGETGTGKELVARYVHDTSPRRDKPFIVVDCGSITETLVDSELFGHRRGSFSGAIEDRKGAFDAAHGGTVFLDEIGEASPAVQQRLLRVLQERQIRPVGETRYHPVDVLVIVATNRDLRQEVEAQRFRRDLYYRLTVLPVHLPPLRERRQDIPLLARHFVEKYRQLLRRPILGIRTDAEACLTAYDFPGNVRELENEIERAMLLCPAEIDHIGVELLSDRVRETPALKAVPGTLRAKVEELERRSIEETLRRHAGNKSRAADELGLSRLGLRQKIERYGLDTA